MLRNISKKMVTVALLVTVMVIGLTWQASSAETLLRAVLDSGIKQLDPIWTTGYAVRTHGFMVYDTLFGLDENFNVKPQMVDTYTVSSNKLVYTFTLRSGLKWHDGTPVTSKDCVASIKRWGAKDGIGQKMIAATDKLEVIDDKTFRLTLKEPFGMVLQGLGKVTSNVCFMMREKDAMTDPNEQVKEVVGSGPFKFVKEQFQPGVTVFYVKNDAYVPRKEPASNMAGSKMPQVDRVEFIWIPDPNTAVNALIAGEIDYIWTPTLDLIPKLNAAKGVKVEIHDPTGLQTILRIIHQQPPFDNLKARQAVLYATNMEDNLGAVTSDSKLYEACPSMYPCGSPLASNSGSVKQDFNKAKQLLSEAGYKGEKIVFLHCTDDNVINPQSVVSGQNLRKAGFNVDMQAMDWATLVSKRAVRKPAAEGGWHIFQTWFNGPDFLNPIEHIAIGAGCEKAWWGWPCDQQIEDLRTAFGKEADLQKQKEIAQAIQKRAFEVVTYVPLGTVYQPVAYRSDHLEGLLKSPAPLFWNVKKK
jgi:peptide/nickel transport system substrate-binding protein